MSLHLDESKQSLEDFVHMYCGYEESNVRTPTASKYENTWAGSVQLVILMGFPWRPNYVDLGNIDFATLLREFCLFSMHWLYTCKQYLGFYTS